MLGSDKLFSIGYKAANLNANQIIIIGKYESMEPSHE